MSKLKWSLLASPLAVCTLIPDSAQAQLSSQSCVRKMRSIEFYRQEASRMGTTAERMREVYEAVDCYKERISESARRNSVSEKTLTAVMIAFGLRNNANAGDIVLAIGSQAAKTALLTREIERLTKELSTTDSQRALTKIAARLADGDLDGAASAFAELNTRSVRDSAISDEKFDKLIAAQADLAYARSDWVEGRRIAETGVAARNYRRKVRKQAEVASNESDRRANLQAYVKDANQSYERGSFFGRVADMNGAIVTLDRDALPFAPRDTAPKDWGDIQNRLGLAKRQLGSFTRDTKLLNQAIVHFGNALEIHPKDIVARHNIATVLLAQANLQDGTELIVEARTILAQLYYTVDASSDHALYHMIEATFGEATGRLGRKNRDAALLERAIRLLESVLQDSLNTPPISGDQINWANSQISLGKALFSLAVVKLAPSNSDSEMSEQALMFKRTQTAATRAQLVFTYSRAPLAWWEAEYMRATALHMQGITVEGGLVLVRESEKALEKLLAVTKDGKKIADVTEALTAVRHSIKLGEQQ